MNKRFLSSFVLALFVLLTPILAHSAEKGKILLQNGRSIVGDVYHVHKDVYLIHEDGLWINVIKSEATLIESVHYDMHTGNKTVNTWSNEKFTNKSPQRGSREYQSPKSKSTKIDRTRSKSKRRRIERQPMRFQYPVRSNGSSSYPRSRRY